MAQGSRARRRPAPAAPALARAGVLIAAAALLLGCQIELVDLGSNHAPLAAGGGGAGGQAASGTGSHVASGTGGHVAGDAGGGGAGGQVSSGPVVTTDCPQVTEAEVRALYGTPCDSTCASGRWHARTVGSAVELVAVTAGRWRTCAGALPGPAGTVGLEFQAGCTLWLLHEAPDGSVVRGIDPAEQGTFNIIETRRGATVTREVELHFPTWRWRLRATTSDCPHRMLLERADGLTLDFAAIPSKSPPLD